MAKCKCGYLMKGNDCFACGNQLEVIHKEPKIKAVSKSTAARLQEYSKKKKQFLKVYPMCAVFPNLKAIDIHHSKGRAGDLLLDDLYWFAVSREGHQKIHDYPVWATENGFKILRSV